MTVSKALWVLFGGLFLSGYLLAADRPPRLSPYNKKTTWQETILAAREALHQELPAKSSNTFAPFTSRVLRGGEPALHISVPVKGVRDLFLYVTGVPQVVYGAATWADPLLITPEGIKVAASRAPGLTILEGQHAIDVNLKSGVSGPLAIAGRTFPRGIHVYADSKVSIPLNGKYARFEAWIGIDDWVGKHGAVRFYVTDAAGAARLDLWNRVARDFPEKIPRRQMRWEREDRILDEDWKPGNYASLARRYARAAGRIPLLAHQATNLGEKVHNPADLDKVRNLYYRSRQFDEALTRAQQLDFQALGRAVEDLTQTFGNKYPRGGEYRHRLTALERESAQTLAHLKSSSPLHQGDGEKGEEAGGKIHNPSLERSLEKLVGLVADFEALQSEALLANPLLDFDRLLLIRREPHGDPRRPEGTGYGLGEYIGLPRQSSKCNPGIDEPCNWDNEIAVLQPVRPEGRLTTLYKPDGRRLITDVDLHWNADRLLFSMPGTLKNWQVFEMGTHGRGLRQLTLGDQPDVHSYDSCYLPNGRIAFISTAPLQGVPCNAGVIVGMMYQMDAEGKNTHQVCFEQDHDYCPTVLNDGRLLYLRWDYTDTPHVWNRVLFAMNPDGTGQAEYYGSNSYWPNAIFYARPIPGHPTKVAGIVTGHHVGRVGELIVFDPARGRHETSGVVQRIPGFGQKVEPLIEDKLTQHSWPKFVHPFPLSERYFLVSCKPTPDDLWGIYLADVFDNLVLVKEIEGQALLEPIPLRRTPPPPIIADKVQPHGREALVYMADVYQGPGLKGIPRGTVKSLRVFTYHFGYQRIAGIDHRVGADGPWEVKRILGTVPVEADGSALFSIPAKTPISVQPLDEEGKAIQLMRSWMTAMPGETLSCIGCHDQRNTAPTLRNSMAFTKPPREIQPWYGPARNFSFRHEVQPVLDRFCVGCHNGSPPPDRQVFPDLRAGQGTFICFRGDDPRPHVIRGVPLDKLVGQYGGIFEPSYIALRRLVRVAGLESDLHLLPPTEFHADNNELIQMLKKGHHGVDLNAEAWDRLYTWIDLNAPSHGTWGEFVRIDNNQRLRRCQLRRLYQGVDEDGEDLPQPPPSRLEPIVPTTPPSKALSPLPSLPGWPLTAAEANRRQKDLGEYTRTLDLGGGVILELARLPAGRFLMGDPQGNQDERPLTAVTLDKPIWMGRCEVTNEQYARFDPTHRSRFEHRGSWIFSEEYLGWPLDGPRQPVVRVSWNEAQAFCRWLGQRCGLEIDLPTEAQWEYACRAGTATPFSFGNLDTDFGPWANLADQSLRDLAYKSWRPRTPDLAPRDDRFNDRALVSIPGGSFRPNTWGLFDMHGNVAEWTRTAFRPYPYVEEDGRNGCDAGPTKVVRGGSWRDRPMRCRSAFRLSYPPYQKVYNVGFRIVCK